MKTILPSMPAAFSKFWLLLCLLPLAALAQVNSGSDGHDGALNPTPNLVIDMADHPPCHVEPFVSLKGNTTLYIGMTNDLKRRMAEHRSGEGNGFTQRYHLNRLV